MTLLNTKSLGVTLGTPLFQNLDLTISKGDRIGLIAANGRGKSTLLKCLAGLIEQTSGEITRSRGLRVGYVPQDVPDAALSVTLYDWVLRNLPPEVAEYESWKVDVALADLQVPFEVQQVPLAELSGGWQRTALLAAAWVNQPDLLLLDEPTNHLDLRRIALLQDWLAALPHSVAILMTSHDRAFLDETTNRTLFIRPDHSRVFNLPFSAAREALDEADTADARQYSNDMNKVRQLRRQAAKLKNVGINSGSDLLLTKTKRLTERAERLEEMARPAHQEKDAGQIRLANSGTHARALVSLEDMTITKPDGAPLYRTGQKWITKGDRVVLLGTNGAGKTRLIQAVRRALTGEEGQIRCASSIIPAYSGQSFEQLNDAATPMIAVTHRSDIGDRRARQVLAGAGIEIARQDRPIDQLSGGQKARLTMLVLRLENPNFYLLDEPTNHLDIAGQELLEAELIAQDTTCLLVSHDRQFIRTVGTRFWWIKGRKLREVDSAEAFLDAEMSGDTG